MKIADIAWVSAITVRMSRGTIDINAQYATAPARSKP